MGPMRKMRKGLTASRRRALLCIGVAVAAVLAALSSAASHHRHRRLSPEAPPRGGALAAGPGGGVHGEGSPLGVLDLVPPVLTFYILNVYWLPMYYLESYMQEAKPSLLLGASVAALVAPAACSNLNLPFGQIGRYAVLFIEALLAVCTWRWEVRGPSWQVTAGSLAGKVSVVTGCNSGIGYDTALALARAGAVVVFACRSEARAREAMRRLVQDAKGVVAEEQLRFQQLDLCSLDSVRSCADQLRQAGLIPDLLILNAGVCSPQRGLSEDGFDAVWAANHFGHFALVNLLLPDLLAVERRGGKSVPRIVVVSSCLARLPDSLDFGEVASFRGEAGRAAALARPYAMWLHYAGTKLANVLHARELAGRLEGAGSRIPVNSVHPGMIPATEIFRGFNPFVLAARTLLTPITWLVFKTQRQGSWCSLFVATAPELASSATGPSGAYFLRLAPSPCTPAMRDTAAAAKLWALSEELTGTRACV